MLLSRTKSAAVESFSTCCKISNNKKVSCKTIEGIERKAR